MTYRLGVDVGGTFTDLVLYDVDTNELEFAKVPSTPADQAVGVTRGIRQLIDQLGVEPDDVTSFIHGTTVATNALLERKGARTALITTAGFRDVLQIGRQDRPRLYDWRAQRPDPLVPRRLRFEVDERILHTGRVHKPLDEGDVQEVLQRLRGADVDAVVVCLLHAYANPAHEEAIGQALADQLPEVTVALSSEILPEFKEYERMSTTTINAYVAPVMGRYLQGLQRSLKEVGIPAELHVMQSNGGIMGGVTAIRKPVHTILSGPAGGVIGSVALAQQVGESNVISIDMGGTSFDISLTYEGEIRRSQESEIGQLPVKVPMVDIHTLGAGGGSIAWIDTGGALRVGPSSAGADPGPACYGEGGDQPTVTDANLVLGRLNPEYFVGGDIALDVEAARGVIQHRVAKPLGLSLEQAAAGIIRVVNANMVKGIRVVSVAKGFDPREFSLVAFGGAGPMHAAELASELNVPRVLVPSGPGVNSALGLLMADLRHDYVRTSLQPLGEVTAERLTQAYAELAQEATAQLIRDGVIPQQRSLLRTADLRYVGQGYELEVPVSLARGLVDVPALVHRFHQLHRRRYGFAHEDSPIELVNLRLSAIGHVSRPELPRGSGGGASDASRARKGERRVYLAGEYYDTPIYRRAHLQPGNVLSGPAVVEQLDSTTLIWPGQTARVDPYRNLIITTNAQ